MSTSVTDEQIRQLAETAKPYSLALLWWGPERHMDGAEATELEHQRRMVSLRAGGVIFDPLSGQLRDPGRRRNHERAA